MLKPEIITTSNNLTVILDHLPHLKSAIVGVWVNVGSKMENKQNNGICHFLEHMVFKGTKNRTSFEISEQIESKGGYMNAWTSKEKTCWYAKVLKNEVPLATNIIFDILLNPTFPDEELAKEKGVILEEIKMYLDSPQDLAHNLYDKLLYNSSSLGYPIIGNADNINKFNREDFSQHLSNHYHTNNTVFVVSGNFDKAELLKTIENSTNKWQSGKAPTHDKPTLHTNKEVLVKKDIEQTHILYGLPAISYKDDNYIQYLVTNNILGSGMSSRFFVEIREKRGLAYSVDSFLSTYENSGSLVVQVGCATEKAKDVINLIQVEMEKAANDIQEHEIEKSKNLLKSSLLMSLENTYSRANRLANDFLNFNKIKDLDELIQKIDSTTKNNATTVLQKLLNEQPTIAVVSNQDISI